MPRLLLLAAAIAGAASLAGCAVRSSPPALDAPPATTSTDAATADINRLLDDPALSRAIVGIRVESLGSGAVLFSRNSDARVIPASSLKIVTAAVAADALGWDRTFETKLEAAGPVHDGVLTGDLVVTGTGDPTINAQDQRPAALFDEWADALRAAGITRIDGRLIGDDTAFDDEPLGAGWAWDYLTAAYAAPSGALSYNENLVAVRISPGASSGDPAAIHLVPPGADLSVDNRVVTAPAGTQAQVTFERLPGSTTLVVRGQVAAGAAPEIRATTVANPTLFFANGLRVALGLRGIHVRDGAWDIDDAAPIAGARRVIATRRSPPLSAIVGQMLKASQNYYGEMLIKALGRGDGSAGSTERGRAVVRQTLERWQVPSDGLVMYDGSGLSRYNYVTADLLVAVLRHVWDTPVLRGPFVAALPVGGHDGTLASRMEGRLSRRVQAKTGTIANVRALAGYAETAAGDKLVFAMIANHYVAPNAQIDAVMERVIERLIQ